MAIERALADLERELALTTWEMRSVRQTPRERAVYHNSLITAKPCRGVAERLKQLTEEVHAWLT